MKTLSSSITPFIKIFAAAWILGIGSGVVFAWISPLLHWEGPLPPPIFKWAILAGWIVPSVFLLLEIRGLKRVRADSQSLLVSNHLKEIVIPFNAIENVTEKRWVNMRPITIHLKFDSEFGRKIRFIPYTMWDFFPWSKPHPVLIQIKQSAGLI